MIHMECIGLSWWLTRHGIILANVSKILKFSPRSKSFKFDVCWSYPRQPQPRRLSYPSQWWMTCSCFSSFAALLIWLCACRKSWVQVKMAVEAVLWHFKGNGFSPLQQCWGGGTTAWQHTPQSSAKYIVFGLLAISCNRLACNIQSRLN